MTDLATAITDGHAAIIRPKISFEFFPPKTEEMERTLWTSIERLAPLEPSFVSVTYGAGGSTRERTHATIARILKETALLPAAHLTCVGASRHEIDEVVDRYHEVGVRHIVALRGDLPSGYGMGGEFRYASDLIAFIRAETGDHFKLAVAAYPEYHPQARSPEADIDAFAAKVRAGANVGITQYFFNADAYFRFVDELRRRGIDTPIVPGIMPITNSTQLLRFSDSCGAEVPRWIRLRLQAFGDDAGAIKDFGADVVAALCERLRQGGAPSLHFYTLNQSVGTLELCRRMGR